MDKQDFDNLFKNRGVSGIIQELRKCDYKSPTNHALLLWACTNGHIDILKEVLLRRPQATVQQDDGSGWCALDYLASRQKKHELEQFFDTYVELFGLEEIKKLRCIDQQAEGSRWFEHEKNNFLFIKQLEDCIKSKSKTTMYH